MPLSIEKTSGAIAKRRTRSMFESLRLTRSTALAMAVWKPESWATTERSGAAPCCWAQDLTNSSSGTSSATRLGRLSP